MAETTIRVPDIGGAEGAEVVEILVAVGDQIELEQSLIVLESDKASMEIPASAAGTVTALNVAVGDQLSEGDAILQLETGEATAGSEVSAVPSVESEPAVESAVAEPEVEIAPAAAPAGESQSQSIEVTIPDIGTDGEVDLVEVLVAVGDSVAEGDSLVILESDKASMEVPAPASGTIEALLVDAGVSVSEGTVIATLRTEGGVASTPAAPAAETPAAPASAPEAAASVTAAPAQAPASAVSAATAAQPSAEGVYAGPAVRKLAREFGIDLNQVKGSGPRNRILKEDLHAFVSNALKAPRSEAPAGAGLPVIPEVDFAKFGDIEAEPRSRIDKLTADNMRRSWLNLPHVTQFDDADITELEQFRADMKHEAERRGLKLSPLPFILKACAVALNAHPKLKSSLADAGDTLVSKHYCNIGMAVDTPAGLVVPVIRDIDHKTVWDIAQEVADLAALARDRKLRADQMQGGVFTVSSLGNIGGRGFTPIVNPPEVAILGVSRADIQPVWDGAAFVPRKMLPLSLSYDHRVINGGDAGRFLTELVGLLADIRMVLM